MKEFPERAIASSFLLQQQREAADQASPPRPRRTDGDAEVAALLLSGLSASGSSSRWNLKQLLRSVTHTSVGVRVDLR